ncbi:MAG: diadenylate cyclase CdaA [Tissierellia bacterium]|nr:diadenylate cyclase CdaA [Tissierellia bacterium]
MDFLNEVTAVLQTVELKDIIDILVVSYAIYKLIQLVKETRAEQLLKGFIAILIISRISAALNLYTVSWVINNLLTVGMVLIIVVFQPELRRVFEKLGRSNNLLSFNKIDNEQAKFKSEELTNAVASLSRQKIGALIVIERKVGLSDIAESGTFINGKLSSELLINIFIPNTPLHDGAVIVNDDKIVAAGCFLPLTTDPTLSQEMGTRHRAALGMSEKSDAFIIVVSEETGIISIVENGIISRYMDPESLKQTLFNTFIRMEDSILKRRGPIDEVDKE